MVWFRVDNRLVHGQVIEGWLPYTGARHLVVANDDLAGDALRQQIVELAIPYDVAAHFACVTALPEMLQTCGDSTFVLFADCSDVYKAFQAGVQIPVLNVGNLHYASGKQQLLPHIAVSESELQILRQLRNENVEFDFRCVPTEIFRGSDVRIF